MKIFLVTKNQHKLSEARQILSNYGIDVEQISEEKYEPKDMYLKEIAEYNARHFYKKYNKPIAIDDTGVFFKEYPNFPGSHPKLIFELLGYKGLLRLLDKNRDAEFKTVIGYCDGSLSVFEGSLKCKVDNKVNDITKEVLPYERIMLVNNKPLSSLSRNEKNEISHRAQAFRKLGEWLNKRVNKSI